MLVTATASMVCSGSGTTLTISGNLNGAANWEVHSASCGGTAVTTTTGTTATVSSITANTTYYLRGEGGSLSTPGSCSAPATVTVNPTPVVSASGTAPDCHGGNNGSITFGTPSAGTSPFTYSINSGTSFQSANIFNGRGAGTDYSAMIKDANTCTSTAQAVTIPAGVDNTPPTITGTYNSTNIPDNSSIAANSDAGNCSAVVNYTVTPSDNCGIRPPTAQTFSYSGVIQHFTVPAGVGKLTVKAWGGGGGGGGNDCQSGAVGGGGAYATSIINVSQGDVLDVYVGGGLNGVTNAANTGGGNGGKEGNAGASGFSGGGGGGGTAVVKGSAVYIVAGGGGAGSGAGCAGTGAAGGGGGVNGAIVTNSGSAGIARVSTTINGVNGVSRIGDGGGQPGGDYGAGGGGTSFASTAINGSGQTPGNSSDPLLCTNCAKGGNIASQGGAGTLIISYDGFQQTAGLASGSAFPVGTTTNTFTATDASANTTTYSFNVVVTDNEVPLISGPPTPVNMAGYCSALAKGSVPLGTASATDNCGFTGGTPNITNDAPAFFPIGTTVVHYSVTDKNGKTGTYNQTVNVTAPATAVSASASVTNALNGTAYPMPGQEIQTIYLGYPSTAQAETMSVLAAGGTGSYTFSWTSTGCGNNVNPLSNITTTPNGSSADFTPGSGYICSGNNDNVYIFTATVTDNHGCAATATKKLNVVDPYVGGGNVQVCHKVAVRGGSSTQLLSVAPSTVSTHLAHGDYLGNCVVFTGSRLILPELSEEQNVTVYPNPTTGVFILELSSIKEGASIVITDVAGKLIATRSIAKDAVPTATFDLSNLAKGLYLIQVRDGELNYRTKIVVQ